MNRLYVYIGRFQPFHNGHLSVIKRTEAMMKPGDGLLVLIGSADRQDCFDNPLSCRLRWDMVNDALKGISTKNYTYVTTINDSPYNYNQWVDRAQFTVSEQLRYLSEFNAACYSADVEPCLVGMSGIEEYADRLGYPYIKMSETVHIHGTDIRSAAAAGKPINDLVPGSVLGKLVGCDFSSMMRNLKKAQDDYYASTGCKYATCFCTVDALVIAGGSVLLVRRKDNGKYALPGGFQNPSETALAGAMRELSEESGLCVKNNPDFILERGPVLFDAPGRDYRCGPYVNAPTHVFMWRWVSGISRAEDDVNRMLGSQESDDMCMHIRMPSVRASDDAAGCLFMKIGDLVSTEAHEFHGDHKKIICNLLGLPY